MHTYTYIHISEVSISRLPVIVLSLVGMYSYPLFTSHDWWMSLDKKEYHITATIVYIRYIGPSVQCWSLSSGVFIV